MKRILFLLAFLAVILPAFSQRVQIGDLYYNLDSSTKTAEVTHPEPRYSVYAMGDLKIPESVDYQGKMYTVTSIGGTAFYGCIRLTSVEIPNSVTEIGISAFKGCTSLSSIVIPEFVTEICPNTFEGCSGLTSIVIPNSVTSIGQEAFKGCTSLSSIVIPEFVTEICPNTFEGCKGLKSVEIPNSVTEIGDYAFSGCSSLTSIVIPNSVTSIGHYAFYGCNDLTSVEIPNSVTSIGQEAFVNCFSLERVYIEDLEAWCGVLFCSLAANPLLYAHTLYLNGEEIKELTIPESVASIEGYAFLNCSSLTSVKIPNSVTSIGHDAFEGCTGLKGVYIDDLEAWCRIDFYGYNSNPLYYAHILYLNGEEIKELTIPYTITSIKRFAFEDCSNLTSVTIPNTITSIGESAFSGCSGLNSIEIGNSVTSIEDYAFNDCPLTKIKVEQPTPPSFYDAFNSYTEEATLIIPDNTIWDYLNTEWKNFMTIEEANGSKAYIENDGVFKYRFIESLSVARLLQDNSYKSMTSVSIPDRVVGDLNGSDAFYKVTSIESAAFKDCSNIAQVKLPASLAEVGSEAFSGCVIIKSIAVPASANKIGESAFASCFSLKRVDISDLEAWCNIDFGNVQANPLYYAKNLCLNNDTVTTLSIPSSVTEIKNYAFYNCKSIGDLQIPNSVTSIGTTAFADIELENCIIADGIEAIEFTGENNINAKNLYLGRNINGPIAFSALDSLEVSGFVDTIPSNCFINNPLTSLVINPGSGIVIDEGAFKGCRSLVEITLPEDIAEIGTGAFSGTALKNLTVPNGTIGENAFAGCNIDNIIIGAGVESIGEKAFDGSNALKAVYATPTTPPAAENNTFSYYEAQLYVPAEAIDTYYNFTRCWYRFSGKPLVMPENIVLEGPEDIKGEPGETFQLTATISPTNVTLDRVLWSSTNPAVATVDNNGLVTIHNFQDTESRRAARSTDSCEIIASTLYENSPVAVVRIEARTAAIEYLNSDDMNSGVQNGAASNDVYTLQGVCVKRQASQGDIDVLAPGIYIIGGRKVIVK